MLKAPWGHSFATSGLQALHVKIPDVKALEAIHLPPVGYSPYNVKVPYVKAREAIHSMRPFFRQWAQSPSRKALEAIRQWA